MALRLEDLPSDAARLTEMVLSLDAENERLRTIVATFKDMVFGSRSEKAVVVAADQFALDLADGLTRSMAVPGADHRHRPWPTCSRQVAARTRSQPN
jgi:hypothetical protein